jgi:hypothetical protein
VCSTVVFQLLCKFVLVRKNGDAYTSLHATFSPETQGVPQFWGIDMAPGNVCTTPKPQIRANLHRLPHLQSASTIFRIGK